jgi:hypothetical protein
MRLLRRILVVVGSVGWLAPLCVSFWAIYDYLCNVVWPKAAFGKEYYGSWHPVSFADELFYFSMGWLAVVLVCWTVHLTAPRRDHR